MDEYSVGDVFCWNDWSKYDNPALSISTIIAVDKPNYECLCNGYSSYTSYIISETSLNSEATPIFKESTKVEVKCENNWSYGEIVKIDYVKPIGSIIVDCIGIAEVTVKYHYGHIAELPQLIRPREGYPWEQSEVILTTTDPLQCTCDLVEVMNFGCKCGAMAAERKLRNK